MRRLLILSTTFYPDPNVASVRVSQWAKWLPEFGWTPHAVCRHAGYDATPEELADAIHPEATVTRLGPVLAKPDARSAGGPPRGGLSGAVRQLLEQVVVPDVGIRRWRSLESDATEAARRISPEVVLSTSPTPAVHWLGRRLARSVGAKWVADFRDPYTIDPRFIPHGVLRPLWLLHRRYERAIYRDADMTVHAIPLQGRWARLAYPEGRDRVRILTNGVPGDVAHTPSAPSVDGPKRLRAVGYLAPEAPRLLGEAMNSLAADGHDLELVHAGPIPPTVDALPPALEQRSKFLGRVPHPEAMKLVTEADVLVAFLSEERSRVLGISSKLFEYFGAGKPILLVNPTRTDRQLVRRVPWCEALKAPSATSLANALRKLLAPETQPTEREWRPLAERYSRRRQTGELATWLDELVS